MKNNKEQILATIDTLPNNATCDDAIYALYLRSKIIKSEEDIRNGKVMTIDESKERMRKLYKNRNI